MCIIQICIFSFAPILPHRCERARGGVSAHAYVYGKHYFQFSTACNVKLCALDKSIYQIYAIRWHLPQILTVLYYSRKFNFSAFQRYTQNWLSEHIFWLNENNGTKPNLCHTACSMLIHFFPAGNEKIIENRIRKILWGLLNFINMSMYSSFV